MAVTEATATGKSGSIPRVMLKRKKQNKEAKMPKKAEPVQEDDDNVSSPESVDGGDEEESEEDESTNSSNKRLHVSLDDQGGNKSGGRANLYAIPSSEELHQLKETTDLFNSNLFKLQLTELLEQVKIKRSDALEKALFQVKKIIEAIPGTQEMEGEECLKWVAPIAIPSKHFHPAESSSKLKYQYLPPSAVYVVGSFILEAMAKSPAGSNVDLAVMMPDALFQAKDHSNYRYFKKRAFYLAVLAKALKKAGFPVRWESFRGDSRRPILIVPAIADGSSTDFSKSKCVIRIFTMSSANIFPKNRLAPSKGNMRTESATEQATPSPIYNGLIGQDSLFLSNLNYLNVFATSYPAFSEAVIVAKVWLNQRGFTGQDYAMNGFLFSVVMGHLIRGGGGGRKLAASASSYQMLQYVLEFLANRDLRTDPIFLTPNGLPLDDGNFSAAAFIKAYDIVIVSPCGRVNLAAGMSQTQHYRLQHEARRTCALLKDHEDHFDDIFLKTVNVPHLMYDHLLSFECSDASITNAVMKLTKGTGMHALADYASPHHYAMQHISSILKRALADRVSFCNCWVSGETASWNVTDAIAVRQTCRLFVGLCVNAEASIRMVEHGPPETEEAAEEEFKNLWGSMSELRRFQDGGIHQSVVFDCDGSLEERSLIVQRMAAFLISRHLGEEVVPSSSSSNTLCRWGGQLLPYIRLPASHTKKVSFQTATEAFNMFCKRLKGLKDLPLAIHTISPIGEGLRYASVIVPQPLSSSTEIEVKDVLEVMIEFETSGRWPDDLEAIQQMKRAFFIRIGQSFSSHQQGTIATVNVGGGLHILDSGYLDVTTTTGYTFRCRIHLDREATLIERGLADARLKEADIRVVEALQLASQAYQNEYVRKPAHASAMINLVFKNIFLSHTIRLVKRWIACHLLFVPDELVELLCISVFQRNSAWATPGSGWVGFTRVLHTLAHHPWRSEVLAVELDEGKMTASVRQTITDRFVAHRKANPAMTLRAMAIATELDMDGCWWGESTPSLIIVERLAWLSKSALCHISKQVQCPTDPSLRTLFVSSLNEYDFVICLDPRKIPSYPRSIVYDPEALKQGQGKYKNLVSDESAMIKVQLMDIDPVQCYVSDLKTCFGHLAYFFHDKLGGNVIAVKLLPTACRTAVPFKVNFSFNAQPVSSSSTDNAEPKIALNTRAMMIEMVALGEGLALGVAIPSRK